MANLPGAPENAATLSPAEARALFRLNKYHGCTTGFCAGYTQANVTILPKSLAKEFTEFCRRNHAPLPLLYRSEPGEVTTTLATGSDIRTDLPRYCVFSKGRLVEDTFDLLGFSWEDYVTFYIGCSFSFESALLEGGLEVRNLTEGKEASIYLSNIRLYPVGPFDCSMVVTMRPFPQDALSKVVEITAQFPNAHGTPIHIGDPARIGVSLTDLLKGDIVTVKDSEVPVFWACGITNRYTITSAKPDLAFTHYPGSMFITDEMYPRKPLQFVSEVIRISRDSAPYFASVLGQKSSQLFPELEQALLDDPGHRGVSHLFQESDLLRATLALSHSSHVAITTGFPCNTQYEVKEETDGLPGALAICQALLCLNKKVTLIADTSNAALFQSCVDHMVSIGGLKSAVSVLPLNRARELWEGGSESRPAFDCLLALEKVGRSKDGTYCTMKGREVSEWVDPVDDLFEEAQKNSLVTTIGIGDGGNELGMGKVYEAVKQHIPLGEKIGCVVGSDFLIVSGVSNWAGYAVAAGLYIVSSCPLHWRYRNHGIDAESPPELDISDFVNTEQATSLLQYMNSVGIRDGISGALDQSVDGLPLTVHCNKMEQISAIACRK